MRIDYKKLYSDRVEEIDYQIKIAIGRKEWVKKKRLTEEKEELLNKIKALEKEKWINVERLFKRLLNRSF